MNSPWEPPRGVFLGTMLLSYNAFTRVPTHPARRRWNYFSYPLHAHMPPSALIMGAGPSRFREYPLGPAQMNILPELQLQLDPSLLL